MLQRVMIAIAISCDPQLLVADEATTALDVTIQAEVLDLLRELRDQRGLRCCSSRHDLAVVAELCDRVVVFYAGEVVESGPTEEIIERPAAPLHRGAAAGRLGRRLQRRELEVIPGQPPAVGADDRRLPVRRRAAPSRSTPAGRPGRPARLGAGHQARCVRARDPELALRAEAELAAR